MTTGFSFDLSSEQMLKILVYLCSEILVYTFSRVSCPTPSADTNGPLVVLFNAIFTSINHPVSGA